MAENLTIFDGILRETASVMLVICVKAVQAHIVHLYNHTDTEREREENIHGSEMLF